MNAQKASALFLVSVCWRSFLFAAFLKSGLFYTVDVQMMT